jgi:hypothetical protein
MALTDSLTFQDGGPNFFDSLGPAQASKEDTSYPKNASTSTGYADALQDVAATYPVLAPHTKNVLAYDATPPKGSEDDGLETYPPWEEFNPHPGKITIEVYKPFQSRQEARDAIAGDLIHIAGAINPSTKQPVDSTYYKMKQEVKKARDAEQIAIDYKAYKDDVKNGEKRSFNKWFENSRSEAYVRGRLFPDKNDEWKSFYEKNPKLKQAVDNIGKYLKTGKE